MEERFDEENGFQFFVSACVVRVAARAKGFPESLVAYHTGILEEHGFSIDKIKYMPAEMFEKLVPSLRAAGYGNTNLDGDTRNSP